MKNCFLIAIFVALIAGFYSCKQQYNPPAIQAAPHYLVVDGFLNGGPGNTVINLSRTRGLEDSMSSSLETGAQITVEGTGGDQYFLADMGNGTYIASNLNLQNTEQYRLSIHTSDGKQYASDYVPVLLSPAIDSITWSQNTDVHIYANTHDPSGNTKYYRWVYEETWAYNTNYSSVLKYQNGVMSIRYPSDQIYHCWMTASSSNIILANSEKLSQDVISQSMINTIPMGSEKLSIKYSILVTQFALTKDGYSYWKNLQQTTEQLGGLFDPQPSQLSGNIHCLTNTGEPVIGYVSACIAAQQRIFISNLELVSWFYSPYYGNCSEFSVPPDSLHYYLGDGNSPSGYVPIVQPFMSPDYILSTSICGDCRAHGGTNVQPTFWQ